MTEEMIGKLQDIAYFAQGASMVLMDAPGNKSMSLAFHHIYTEIMNLKRCATIREQRVAEEIKKNVSEQGAEQPINQKSKEDILGLRIEDLDVPKRVVSCCYAEKIYTVNDLIKTSWREVRKIPNFGVMSKIHLQDALFWHGISLKE